MTHLLIVDDEPHVLSALRRMLLNAAAPPVLPDPQLTACTSPVQALEHVANHRVDLVISDYRMPGMDGVSFLTRVKELQPDTARIMMSASPLGSGTGKAGDYGWIYALYELGQTAASGAAPLQVQQDILEHIVSGFDAQSGSIALCVEGTEDLLEIAAGIDLPPGVIGG